MADDRRITIYLGKPLQEVLAAADVTRSASGRLNDVAERYLDVVRRSMPTLSLGEWQAIVDALNGTVLGPVEIRAMSLDIAETDGLAQKWSVDQSVLAETVGALPFASKLAIADVVERFWAHQPSDVAMRDQLINAGARIADARID